MFDARVLRILTPIVAIIGLDLLELVLTPHHQHPHSATTVAPTWKNTLEELAMPGKLKHQKPICLLCKGVGYCVDRPTDERSEKQKWAGLTRLLNKSPSRAKNTQDLNKVSD